MYDVKQLLVWNLYPLYQATLRSVVPRILSLGPLFRHLANPRVFHKTQLFISSHFPLPPPYPIPSLLIYALPVWGVVVRSRGRNSILTNLTQFVERLARGRVQPVKHWPLASGWEMGYGDGFGWGANMDFSFWRYSLWNVIFLMKCSDKANVQVAKNRVN